MTAEERKAYQEHTKETVRNNLLLLFKRIKNPKKTVADVCGVKQSSITRWVSEDKTYLPGPEHLKSIANLFGVSVDWILSDHTADNAFNRVTTYADAIFALVPLIENQALNIETVSDPILKYLCQDYHRTFHSYMPEDQKKRWISDVMLNFNVSLPEECPTQEQVDLIRENNKTVPNLNPFFEYANLAKVISNPNPDYQPERTPDTNPPESPNDVTSCSANDEGGLISAKSGNDGTSGELEHEVTVRDEPKIEN